jgi:hypothetical protein
MILQDAQQSPPAIRSLAVLSLVFAVAIVPGCRQTTTDRLVGTWQGRPDTAAAYRQRQEFATPTSSDEEPTPSEPPAKTVLEEYDFAITMDLHRDGSATMWRDDGLDRLDGTWKVLESTSHHVRLQLATARNADDPTTADSTTAEVRNYRIDFTTDDAEFTLAEEGADPQFGALLFRRM